MAQNTILEFLYTRVSTNKFFYEVQQKSTRKTLKCRKRYIPTSRKAGVFKAPSWSSYKIHRRRKKIPTSCLTQERRKVSTDELPTRRVQDLPSSFFVLRFAQFKKAKDFYTTSYLQGQRSVCPKPRIPFSLVHEYWGSEVTRLGQFIGSYETSSTRKPCAKAVPETDSFTQ